MTYTPAVPWLKHQRDELVGHWDARARALYWETGVGKTGAVVGNFGLLLAAGRVGGLVVICPKNVRGVWAGQFGFPPPPDTRVHTHPDLLNNITTTVWRSGARSALWGYGDVPVMIVNVEALSTGTGAYTAVVELLNQRSCLFVVDELSRVKSSRTKRTKSVIDLARRAEYRRILSGTPSSRSPLDLYSQFMALDWRILGHKSYFTFQRRYAVLKPLYLASRTIQVVDGYQNLDELSDKIRPYTSRILKRDCLDLPPVQYRRREVELTSEQRRAYNDLRDVAVTELAGGHVSAPAVISQILRCHQVLCGHVGGEDGTQHAVSSNRLAVLIEHLDETDGRAVIFCTYRANVVEVTAELNREYGEGSAVSYYGGTPEGERERNLRAFSSREGPRFFVASPQTGGIGLDGLQNYCSTMIFFSNSYDLELREQAEGRLNRVGQREPVVYVDLVAPGTLDETILRALREKIDLARAVMRDGPRQWIV